MSANEQMGKVRNHLLRTYETIKILSEKDHAESQNRLSSSSSDEEDKLEILLQRKKKKNLKTAT